MMISTSASGKETWFDRFGIFSRSARRASWSIQSEAHAADEYLWKILDHPSLAGWDLDSWDLETVWETEGGRVRLYGKTNKMKAPRQLEIGAFPSSQGGAVVAMRSETPAGVYLTYLTGGTP